MNDLDTLRCALSDPPEPNLTGLDIGQVVIAGRRLRRQRRWAAAGIAAVVTVGVFAAGSWIGGITPADSRRGSTIGRAGDRSAQASPSPGSSRTSYPRLGAVIQTGLADSAGRVVLYFVAVDAPELPNTHFALMVGYEDIDGNLTDQTIINEFTTRDDAPGFHGVALPISNSPSRIPIFGYFVGDAVRIVGRRGARTFEAHLARWSMHHQVIAFWFNPDEVPVSADSPLLVAYDAAGNPLG